MRIGSELSIRIGRRLERMFELGRGAFSLVGMFSLLFLTLHAIDLKGRPGTAADEKHAHSANVATEVSTASTPTVEQQEISPPQKATARLLARNYRIAEEVAQDYVLAAFEAGNIVGLDPGLLLAVMAIESRFNPIAQSDMGAKGLMQVIPRFHEDKLNGHGGAEAVLVPWVNILVGAQILREYIARAGSLEGGLQWYNGAPNDRTRQYAEKILSEKAQLDRVLSDRRAKVNAGTRI